MRIKRTEADKWFSKCVRISQNWICESCGTDYSNNTRGLDCSHFIGRAHYSIRFNPMNAFAHCMGCHQRLGDNPPAFIEHAEEHIGTLGIEMLKTLQHDTGLGRAMRGADKDGTLSKHYREQFRSMEKMRQNGVMGVIPFIAWMPESHESIDIHRWALDHVS